MYASSIRMAVEGDARLTAHERFNGRRAVRTPGRVIGVADVDQACALSRVGHRVQIQL